MIKENTSPLKAIQTIRDTLVGGVNKVSPKLVSCLRARVGFKRQFLSNLFYSLKPKSLKKQSFLKIKCHITPYVTKKCHVLFEWPFTFDCVTALPVYLSLSCSWSSIPLYLTLKRMFRCFCIFLCIWHHILTFPCLLFLHSTFWFLALKDV